MSAHSITLNYSRGKSKFDNCPEQRQAVDFREFAKAVLSDRAPTKGGPYVCAAFAEGDHNNKEKYPAIATWRQKHLARPRNFLPLDLDGFDSPETFARVLKLLRRFEGFAYTTASHTPDAPRCRVVLAQTRPTGYDEGMRICEAVQSIIEQEIGEGKIKFDPTVYRGEQPFYAPPINTETFEFGGEPVNVDDLLASAPASTIREKPQRLEKVKTDDGLLRAMAELGMIKKDAGGGKFLIECPFAEFHTMDGGQGETSYWLPHTGGFAQSHFHCLHANCALRTDQEFALAVFGRYTAELGPAPFAVDFPPPARAVPGEDSELTWIMENAPSVLKAYCNWYQQNAIRPHPVFALVSGLTFAQLIVGRNYAHPRGLAGNLWMLLLAPTESGKGDVHTLAVEAVDQLAAQGVQTTIARPEVAFGSIEGLWWLLDEVGEVLWFDEELAKSLAGLLAASEATPKYAMRRGLLVAHDKAGDAFVPPVRYSARAKSGAREMQPLRYPFFSLVGTGVPRDLEKFTAAAAQDGMLNRFLIFVLDDMPAIGSIDSPSELPAAVVDWARQIFHRTRAAMLVDGFSGPLKVETYAGLRGDWRALMQEGTEAAQDLPGIWGRFASKVWKVALLRAVMEDGKLTPAGVEWATRLVRWVVTNFAAHFAAQGGGAENDFDALRNAFLSVFDVPSLEGREAVPASYFAKFNRHWKTTPKRRRDEVVQVLIEDGLIELVDMKPKGIGYRRVRE